MCIHVYTQLPTCPRFTISEPQHEISNNVVCATSKASDQPMHTHSLIRAFASRLNKNHHLEFLSSKGGCTGSTESEPVKMQFYWILHVGVHFTHALSTEWASLVGKESMFR